MTGHTEYRRMPGMAKIEVWAWQCERCSHFWLPRDWDRPPKVCPKCKSPYWDRPRRKDIAAGKVSGTRHRLHPR